jgi:4-hydroxybenzoate polyprenyltransferase
LQYFGHMVGISFFSIFLTILTYNSGYSLAMAASRKNISFQLLLKNALLFLLIATLYHSAFCVWNDICDKDLDGKVGELKMSSLISMASPNHIKN